MTHEKVFRCTSCQGIYLDQPVTRCDCTLTPTEFTEWRLVPVDPWLSMESAPKDGTRILLNEQWGEPFIGRWVGGSWHCDTYNVGIDGDATIRNDVDDQWVIGWMPLPAAMKVGGA